MPEKYTILFRETDREIFNMVKTGEKKVETRAGGPKYQDIKKGDVVVLKCGKSKFERMVAEVRKFKSVNGMLRRYKPSDIHPKFKSAKELMDLYESFPGYAERLKKYGIIAFKLK